MKSEFNKKSHFDRMKKAASLTWKITSSAVSIGVIGGGLYFGYANITAPDDIEGVFDVHSIAFSEHASYQSMPYHEPADPAQVKIRAAHFESGDHEGLHGQIAAASLDFQNQMKCAGGCYSTTQLNQNFSLLSTFEKKFLKPDDHRDLIYSNVDIITYSQGAEKSWEPSKEILDIFFESSEKINSESKRWLNYYKSLIFHSAGNDGDLDGVDVHTIYLNDIFFELKSDTFFGVGAVYVNDGHYHMEGYSSPTAPTFVSETPFELMSDGGLHIKNGDDIVTYKEGTSYSAPNAGGKFALVMAQVEKKYPDVLTEYDYVFAAMLSANQDIFDGAKNRYGGSYGWFVDFRDNGNCSLSYNFNFAGFGVIETEPMMDVAKNMAYLVSENPTLRTIQQVHTQTIEGQDIKVIQQSYYGGQRFNIHEFALSSDAPMVGMTKQLYIEFDGPAPAEIALTNSKGVEFQVPVQTHGNKLFLSTHAFAGNDVDGTWSILHYGESSPQKIKTIDYGVQKGGVVSKMLNMQANPNHMTGKCEGPVILVK